MYLKARDIFDPAKEQRVGSEHLVIFDDGDSISIAAADQTMQCLLVSGQPIEEPVAWRGPIVMNTEEELRKAFEDYRNGTFVQPHNQRTG